MLALFSILACITATGRDANFMLYPVSQGTTSPGQHEANTPLTINKKAEKTPLSTYLAANAVNLHLVPGFLSLRHRNPPRPPLHVACLFVFSPSSVKVGLITLRWWDAGCVAVDQSRDGDPREGSPLLLLLAGPHTARSQRETPLHCNRCEYGGSCGT